MAEFPYDDAFSSIIRTGRFRTNYGWDPRFQIGVQEELAPPPKVLLNLFESLQNTTEARRVSGL